MRVILGVFIGFILVAFGYLMVFKYPSYHAKYQEAIKNTESILETRRSPSIAYIQDTCGVLGSDYLWTTSMDKIAKCIRERDAVIAEDKELIRDITRKHRR